MLASQLHWKLTFVTAICKTWKYFKCDDRGSDMKFSVIDINSCRFVQVKYYSVWCRFVVVVAHICGSQFFKDIGFIAVSLQLLSLLSAGKSAWLLSVWGWSLLSVLCCIHVFGGYVDLHYAYMTGTVVGAWLLHAVIFTLNVLRHPSVMNLCRAAGLVRWRPPCSP